ncbi:MAG: cytochrome P450 [Pseudoxanthomonas sp.]
MGKIERIVDFDDKEFNPFFSDEMAFGDTEDLYGRLAELRQQAAVHPVDYRTLFSPYPDVTLSQFKHFTVLSHDLVSEVLNNPDTFTNQAFTYNLGKSFGRSISTMDAPEHPRYRRIFQKAFLPQVVSQWGETLVDPVVKHLMDKFVDRGEADLVQEFTLYYPFHIIYRQLDLPQEDIETFHKLAIAQSIISIDFDHGSEAARKLGDYFKGLLAVRRENPGDDLVSMLAQAEVDGEKLPEEILISFLRQLINAGGDTTYRGTSNLLVGLLSNPEQLDAVRQDRSLVPQAIEEALRWEGPVGLTWRMAAKDTVLGDVEIPAGSVIDLVQGAANRDPAKFPDPDKFDIFREKTARHFGFAAGPHICIGQHLARVEMTRALNAILDRMPNLRLDPDKPEPSIRGFMMRVPKHIFVKYG